MIGSMARLLAEVQDRGVDIEHIAVHCHDTYGQALANILVSLQVSNIRVNYRRLSFIFCTY
jgi:isopropylmalate/homocitrate/citramalate synthase